MNMQTIKSVYQNPFHHTEIFVKRILKFPTNVLHFMRADWWAAHKADMSVLELRILGVEKELVDQYRYLFYCHFNKDISLLNRVVKFLRFPYDLLSHDREYFNFQFAVMSVNFMRKCGMSDELILKYCLSDKLNMNYSSWMIKTIINYEN